jgi:hypothetical protein
MAMTTGELGKRIGLIVPVELFKKLDVHPDDLERGKPKWSEENFKEFIDALTAHLAKIRNQKFVAPAKPAKKPVPAAAPADDDDDL